MTRSIIVYGSIAGLVVIAGMVAQIVLLGGHGGSSVWLGYLTMLVGLSLIFVAVKRYRDVECGGVVRFLPAFLLGLGIAVAAGVAYVIGWEIYLAATHYAFMEEYTAGILEAKRAQGLAGPALAAEAARLETMKTQYDNPLFRLPMTFVEIFPVGLLIALVSAGLLRNPRFLPARQRSGAMSPG